MPAEAIEALENDVGYLIYKILDLRAYARAKETYDSSPPDKRPRTTAMDLVSEITMGIAKKEIIRRRQLAEKHD